MKTVGAVRDGTDQESGKRLSLVLAIRQFYESIPVWPLNMKLFASQLGSLVLLAMSQVLLPYLVGLSEVLLPYVVGR